MEHGVDLYASDPLCVQHGGGGRVGPYIPYLFKGVFTV